MSAVRQLATTAQTISGAKTFVDNVVMRGSVQVSGTQVNYSPQYQGTVGSLNRYLTSGETLDLGSRSTSNSWTGTFNTFQGNVTISGVTAFGTIGGTTISAAGAMTVSGLSLFYLHSHFMPTAPIVTEGGLQISGSPNIAYQPLYQGTVAAPNRYIVSGEQSTFRLLNSTVAPITVSGINFGLAYSVSVPANTLSSGHVLKYSSIASVDNQSGGTLNPEYRIMFGGKVVASGVPVSVLSTATRGVTIALEIVPSFITTVQYAATLLTTAGNSNYLTVSGIIGAVAAVPILANNIWLNADTTQSQLFEVYYRPQAFGLNMNHYTSRLEIV